MEETQNTQIWRTIFDQCYDRLSDQNLPCLKDYIFEYIMSDTPKETPFYEYHQKELDAIEAFRRCFRRNMLVYDQQVADDISDIRSLIVDLIMAESNSILENMAESWIPGLRLSALNSLSGEVYESAHASGQTIVILPDNNMSDITAFHKNNHLPLESNLGHAVRKQLSICGKSSALAVALEGNEYKTQGTVPLNTEERFPSIRFVNHLHWELHLPAKRISTDVDDHVSSKEKGRDKKCNKDEHSATYCIIRFCKGTLRFPLLNIDEEYRSTANQIFEDETIAKNITTLLKKVDAKKGTSLVFSSPKAIKEERKRLAIDNHRGVPFLSGTSYPLLKNKTVHEDLLNQLSSIDGALLVDTKCRCHAFGVILDGEAVGGSPNRGARYNSMLSYIKFVSEKYPEDRFLCAVFSEDGMVNIFSEQ